MRILQILPELNVGGVETGTLDFAKYLMEHGHISVVVSNGGEMVDALQQAGSTHYQLPVHKKSLFSVILMIGRLRKIIVAEGIDIVHARSRVPAWIAFFACRKTKAFFITTCHGYYKNRFFSQVMGWAKLIIVPSMAIGRHMIDDFNVLAKSIRCIPRSVNVDKFNIVRRGKKDESSPVISIIGRLTPLKGHKYFIKAMTKVVRQYPYAKIWIIGDAPASKKSYRKELELLSRRLGLASQIEFLGNRTDIPELLSKTDVLVLSTVTQESFGRVILEAQAAGVPVVATRVGGVIDIIDDNETGILIMPKDSDAIAKDVIRLLNDRDLVARLVVAAKKKLQDCFTLEHMSSSIVEVYQELTNSLNVLVIKIGSIGDVILITAALKSIREKFPNARIHCLVGKESRKVLQNCPYLDGLIIYDHLHRDKGYFNFIKLASRLRKYRFDKVIDFQNNRKSHILTYLSFTKESYGYDNGKWGRLLTNRIKDDKRPMAAVAHQYEVLRMLDIQHNDRPSLELWPSKQDQSTVESLLDAEWLGNSKNLVGLNIGASGKWPTKNWPLEYIAQLCDLLSKKNIRVVITGMENDKEKIQQLFKLTKTKPANLVGKTDILQLAALMKHCKVFITPDSAPMHVAASMGTPFISFFGPTDSARHIPPSQRFVVLEKKLACAPCYSKRCRIMTHACMRDITPEEVMLEVESMMGIQK